MKLGASRGAGGEGRGLGIILTASRSVSPLRKDLGVGTHTVAEVRAGITVHQIGLGRMAHGREGLGGTRLEFKRLGATR